MDGSTNVSGVAEWDKEEFEDLVARAIIAIYETKLIHNAPAIRLPPGVRWGLDPWQKGTKKDISIMRNVGPYFSPSDRIFLGSHYWHDIDGIPARASWAFKRENRDHLDEDADAAYLDMATIEKVQRFPRGCLVLPAAYVAKYRVTNHTARTDGIESYSHYVGLRGDGAVIQDQRTRNAGDMSGCAVLQIWGDSKHLWNVTAREHEARASFGVYEEQIKSLFYSRTVPMTDTGRKRPILHWVRAHRRRISEGTSVNVTKHMRGITEFEMGGTLFQITRPMKRAQSNHDGAGRWGRLNEPEA